MSSKVAQRSDYISRRDILAGVSGTALFSLTGCTIDEIGQLVGEQGSEVEYGSSSPGFKRIGWTSNNILEIEFADDHGMDEFAFRHESQSLRNSLAFGSAPNFAGTVELDVLSVMEGEGGPPAGKYEFVALEGGFTADGGIEINELGSVSFHIEPVLEIQDTTVRDDYLLEIEIENSGNAPATGEFVAVEDNQVSASGIVGLDETATIQTDEPPFPESDDDSRCIELLEEFTVELGSLPRLGELSTDVSTEFDFERRCTRSI